MKALLADQILATPDREFKGFHFAPKMKNLKRDLRQAVIIDADDIADLYRGESASKNLLSPPGEMEGLAPPFDLFWIEYDSVSSPDLRSGVLFRVHPESMLQYVAPRYQGKDVKWSLEANMASHDGDCWDMDYVHIYYEIDRTGRLVQHGTERQPDSQLDPSGHKRSHQTSLTAFMENYPAFKAIELLHRRSGTKGDIGASKVEREQYRCESIKELLRHNTLKVIPGPKVKSQNMNTSSSYRYALHLTRGHFKTYDESNKLLGKHVGTYWWEPQIRGSKDKGIISKDYRVSA